MNDSNKRRRALREIDELFQMPGTVRQRELAVRPLSVFCIPLVVPRLKMSTWLNVDLIRLLADFLIPKPKYLVYSIPSILV